MTTKSSSLATPAENGRPADSSTRKPTWHKSVSRKISSAVSWDTGTDGWEAWSVHLSRRRKPRPLADRLGSRGASLAWSLPVERLESDTLLLIARLHQLARKKRRNLPTLADELAAWLPEVDAACSELDQAARQLAWCHALPHLAEVTPADTWWDVLYYLIEVASASDIQIEADPLVHQLTAGELPLTLAYLFPEIRECRKLAARGRRELSSGLDVLLDGEGLPAARHLELLRPLLACWTRSRAMGQDIKRGCWDASAQLQYEWVVRQALRFCRADGVQPLSADAAGAWEPELFQVALALGGDVDDLAIAQLALPKRRDTGRRHRRRLPAAGYQCEWAEAAMLRCNWRRNSPLLATHWNEGQVSLELAAGRQVLFSGAWEFQLRWNGKVARPRSEWDVVCWESDNDADYLELEIALTERLRLQRQLLLTREDNLLLAADAILSERSGEIEYESKLPLGGQIEFQPAEQHHEAVLAEKKPRARILPLGLPEWRREPADGRLDRDDRKLRIRQSTTGRGLYVPLMIDLDTRRLARPYTWRRLTVAENRQIVPAGTAVGFRVQLGSEQWIVYRSFTETASRTLLGHNLVSEFLLARFLTGGEVEPLLEVE